MNIRSKNACINIEEQKKKREQLGVENLKSNELVQAYHVQMSRKHASSACLLIQHCICTENYFCYVVAQPI